MTQTEARRQVKEYQAKGIPLIAGTYPLSSWGGREKCWAVYLLVSGSLELVRTEVEVS